MLKWEISPEDSGLKLVQFLQKKLGASYSARQIKRFLEKGSCTLNGVSERFASTILGLGDIIVFHLDEEAEPPSSIHFDKGRILYEDDALLCYDKPVGVVSDSKEFIMRMLAYHPKLELVHRLDKETSGALLFAKSPEMRLKMIDLFRQQQIVKTYLAIIDGIPQKKRGTVDNYLAKRATYEGQALWGSIKSQKGLHAVTEWEVTKVGKEASLLTCHPLTGRTHQIRVHLSELGHPILGDLQYGRRSQCSYRPGRLLLHAAELSFVHPLTGQKLVIKAPMPEDFMKAMIMLFEAKG